jgi:hypothetical protein
MTSVKPVNIEPIRFEWPTLRYYYFTTPIVREGESGESDDSEGLGRMMFTSHGEAPKRFEGIYSYGGLHGRAVVKGRRATAEEIKDLHQDIRNVRSIGHCAQRWTFASSIRITIPIPIPRSGALHSRKPHPDQLSVPIDDRAIPPMHVLVLVKN